MKDKILNKYMKEGSSSIPKRAKKKIKDGLSMLVTKKGGGPLESKKKKTRKREKESMPKIKKQAKELKIKAKDKEIAGDPTMIQSAPTFHNPYISGKNYKRLFEEEGLDDFNKASFYNKKKHGGRITYRMTGGQVVDSSYD
tara:strand:+ start:12732 stop:13154 length:423 start_codon:yes stop_codon:yes gene_type:complete